MYSDQSVSPQKLFVCSPLLSQRNLSDLVQQEPSFANFIDWKCKILNGKLLSQTVWDFLQVTMVYFIITYNLVFRVLIKLFAFLNETSVIFVFVFVFMPKSRTAINIYEMQVYQSVLSHCPFQCNYISSSKEYFCS